VSGRTFLLVYPEFPDTYWSYRHALNFIGKKALMPPLGLATVAAMLPKGVECNLVDMNIEPLRSRDIAEAELVMISAMIVQKDSVLEIISRCRAADVPVALGGPYATSCHGDIEGVDYFILGEGEITLPRFLADYEAGNPAPAYHTDERPDIALAPIPRFDLLKMDYYDTLPLQYSRGCPFDCEFCDIVHLFGHKPRTKSPDQFIAELDAAHAVGFTGAVFIVDDNFIGNRREVKHLLARLAAWQKEHGHPYHISTEASIDLAEDDELLQLMVEAGFSMVFIGIESPVADSLAGAGKKQNLRRDIRESIRKIQALGIEVTGGFIIGFDTDPPDIFDLQIEFIKELAIPTAMVGLLMALPNTRLYERLLREGRILSASTGNNTHQAELNFTPKLPRDFLLAGYRRVLGAIYEPRTYFNRCLEVLRRYPHTPEDTTTSMKRPIRLREVTGFVRSLLRQTFSSYGIHYLRYLFSAVRLRPALIVRIITMAIQGHHYFTITRRAERAAPAYAQKRFRESIGRDTITAGIGNQADA